MAAESNTATLPSNWTDDLLSDYANQAFRNMLATFVQKKPQFGMLIEIDGLYVEIGESLSHPENILAPLFVTRSHSAYRAGCQLASGGQVSEAFCVLRACLECALYCLHIYEHDTLGEVWLRRHDSAASLKASRNEFSHGKVMATLRKNDPKLCATVQELYERTIDYGGHPNERSITGSMKMEASEDEVEVKQYYLHGDSLYLEHGLKSSAQIGLGGLYILRLVFRERFDILDITSSLDQLRKHL